MTIYTPQLLHRISEDIKKSHRMPPKSLLHKRQGDGNFASGRGVWEPKISADAGGNAQENGEPNPKGEKPPVVVAGEIHGDVWGCFLFGKIKVSDGFFGTIAMVCFQSYFQLRCLWVVVTLSHQSSHYSLTTHPGSVPIEK